MPTKVAVRRARRDKRTGKAATTQAGEFVREEMKKLETGKGRARSRKQAIAIGLSEARREGVEVPAPRKGQASDKTRRSAQTALRRGRSGKLAEKRGARAAPSQAAARSTSRRKPASSSRAASRGRSAGRRSSRSQKRSR